MSFPTTHWSVLAKATLDSDTSARSALDHLCRRYWSPLHQFIRSRGYTEADAADLTQDFLLHLMEHSTLRIVDPTRGLFRSFLLGTLTRFLHDEYDRRHAQKRGAGALHLSLEQHAGIPGADGAGTSLFDREWALAVLESALRQTQEEIESNGGAGHFVVLRRFLPGSLDVPTYVVAAAELGVSVPALTSDVHRLRRLFKSLLLQEVGRTVSSPHELTEEMAYLRQILMDRGNDFEFSGKDSPEIP